MFIFPSPWENRWDGDRESESGTYEEICAFYEIATKLIAIENLYCTDQREIERHLNESDSCSLQNLVTIIVADVPCIFQQRERVTRRTGEICNCNWKIITDRTKLFRSRFLYRRYVIVWFFFQSYERGTRCANAKHGRSVHISFYRRRGGVRESM